MEQEDQSCKWKTEKTNPTSALYVVLSFGERATWDGTGWITLEKNLSSVIGVIVYSQERIIWHVTYSLILVSRHSIVTFVILCFLGETIWAVTFLYIAGSLVQNKLLFIWMLEIRLKSHLFSFEIRFSLCKEDNSSNCSKGDNSKVYFSISSSNFENVSRN